MDGQSMGNEMAKGIIALALLAFAAGMIIGGAIAITAWAFS